MLLLADLAAGDLPPGTERQMAEAHVRDCPDCRESLDLLLRIRAEIARNGPAILEEHPDSGQIVAFATADPELDPTERDRISAHVDGCPSCAEDIALARRMNPPLVTPRAIRFPPFLWSRWSTARQSPWNWGVLRPVMGVVVILGLLIPAYRGIFVLPSERRGREAVRDQLDGMIGQNRQLQSDLEKAKGEVQRLTLAGGAFPLLYFPTPTRGSDVVLPEVALDSNLPSQPVLIACDLESITQASVPVLTELRSPANGTLIWSHEDSVERLCNRTTGTANVLLPTSKLSPGTWRLELRLAGNDEPFFRGDFRIVGSVATP